MKFLRFMQARRLCYIIVLVIVTFVGHNAGAQVSFQDNYYPLAHGDTVYKVILTKELKAQLDFLSDSLTRHAEKEKKKEYREIFKEQYEYISDRFENNNVLWDDSITIYLNKVMNKLVKANPELAKKRYLLTNRTGNPNAFSAGEGIIFFNLGLLARLRNEAEIAFVLAHELAHDKYDHVTKGIIKRVETVNDKAFKAKLDEVTNSDYNTYHKMQQLLKNTLFDFNKHGREYESFADSLGALWMARAGYEPQAAFEALGLLDTVDEEKYPEPIDYKKIFSTPDFSFKDSWLHGEDFLKGFKTKKEFEDEDNDTLKTHPDCKKRVEAIKRLFGNGKYDGTEGTRPLKDNLNLVADFEIIQHEYEAELYGASLYNALHLAQKFPDNVYLKAMIAKNIYFLHKSLKEHDFSAHTDLPHPYYNHNYNLFLNFINNLRSSEFTDLALNFIKKNGSDIKDKRYEFAVILCLSMAPEKTSLENLIAGYQHEYPGTPEAKYLTEKLNSFKPTKKN